ncbi:MAG: sigma-54-dependent Fis family transcriptional regulator [Acetobacterium sp.]
MDIDSYKIHIENSQERCLQMGIKKDLIYSKKMIDHSELQVKFSENRDLILAASPYMEHLISIVKGTNFFVLLTDKDGCILNAIGDEKILSEAFELKMIPGAYMNEESIGTNAMSYVIKVGAPVQLSGEDHYVNSYHRWTCSGAPINDANGNLIGVLDLTGYTEFVHPHTLGMVIAASNAIEEMLKVKEYNRLQNMTNKHIKTIFNSMPVAILTSDLDGKIKIHNQKALELFGNKVKKLTNRDINELIDGWDDIKEALHLEKNVSRVIEIKALRNHFPCHMTASPIYNPQDDSIEIVYVLEEKKAKRKENAYQPYYTFDKIIGHEQKFTNAITYAKKIADSRSTILISGDSGCGKEVFAQSIHNFSKRMDEPFIALNCGAIPHQLIESELFGYEEGAYTGAKKGGNLGKFELANNGTIMLDEIGEMPLDMQIRLLRVLQENTITRIGSPNSIRIDVRIIAATNKDLKKEVELGRFRKDLFYRLNVLPLYLPPLKERKSDIGLLFNHFMKTISEKCGKEEVTTSKEDNALLESYDWPGNIRELENVVELIVNTESFPTEYFSQGSHLEKKIHVINEEDSEDNKNSDDDDLVTHWNDSVGVVDLTKFDMSYVEKEHLVKVLEFFKGNISQSAQALGMQRNTLYSKIKKHHIDM